MKTTIDIADDLLLRAKARAKERKMTLRRLIEQALADELERHDGESGQPPKFILTDGNGLTSEFQGAGWESMRDAIYAVEETAEIHRP